MLTWSVKGNIALLTWEIEHKDDETGIVPRATKITLSPQVSTMRLTCDEPSAFLFSLWFCTRIARSALLPLHILSSHLSACCCGFWLSDHNCIDGCRTDAWFLHSRTRTGSALRSAKPPGTSWRSSPPTPKRPRPPRGSPRSFSEEETKSGQITTHQNLQGSVTETETRSGKSKGDDVVRCTERVSACSHTKNVAHGWITD